MDGQHPHAVPLYVRLLTKWRKLSSYAWTWYCLAKSHNLTQSYKSCIYPTIVILKHNYIYTIYDDIRLWTIKSCPIWSLFLQDHDDTDLLFSYHLTIIKNFTNFLVLFIFTPISISNRHIKRSSLRFIVLLWFVPRKLQEAVSINLWVNGKPPITVGDLKYKYTDLRKTVIISLRFFFLSL